MTPDLRSAIGISRVAPIPKVTSARPIPPTGGPERPLRVTIIAANPFLFDSRFLRSAESLAADGHDVTVAAWSAPGLPPTEELAPSARLVRIAIPEPLSDALRPLPRGLRRLVCRAMGLDPEAVVLPADPSRGWDRLRHPLRRACEILAVLRRLAPWTEEVLRAAPATDVFHCQSLVALPVAQRAAKRLGARFVYDVADYHPESERIARMPRPLKALVAWREARLARRAAGFLAVSDPVARLVGERWGVAPPAVLLNCPPAWRPGNPGPVVSHRLRDAVGVGPERPVVLYQGGFSIDRGLEELVAAMDDPGLVALAPMLVLMGYGRLQDWLEGEAVARADRMRVIPAVPVRELMEWTAGADVSFVGQPPRTLNHRMNLPNKLFESIMAGVPVIVSEGNEQCRLVTAEGIGECVDVDHPSTIARALERSLSRSPRERCAIRSHCRTVALERYSWERTAGGLVDLYRRLASATV
jgi:glycosyltransferase involved in cell wall biosynthesis